MEIYEATMHMKKYNLSLTICIFVKYYFCYRISYNQIYNALKFYPI